MVENVNRPPGAPCPTPGIAGSAYMPALDGLRAVSILLVVMAHLGLTSLVPGGFGVTLFFFISGYLITGQLLGNRRKTGRIGFALFYARRALRLLPAGLAFILLAGLAFRFLGGRIDAAAWLAAVFYGANYYDIWVGYRSNLPGIRHPFNILWSLAVEEHFYALWPAVLAWLPLRRAGAAVLGLCLAVLAWRLFLLHACTAHIAVLPAYCGPAAALRADNFNRFYEATDTRLDSIAWGALLAVLQARMPGQAVVPGWRALLGAALLAGSFALTDELGRHALRGTVQGVGLLALVPWLLLPGSWPNRALCWKPALLLGRLSYSLYLWHWAALMAADAVAPANRAVWLLVAAPLSAVLACGSYWGIERPMLLVRRRFGSHAV